MIWVIVFLVLIAVTAVVIHCFLPRFRAEVADQNLPGEYGHGVVITGSVLLVCEVVLLIVFAGAQVFK